MDGWSKPKFHLVAREQLKYWSGYHRGGFIKPIRFSQILMVHQIYEVQNIAEA